MRRNNQLLRLGFAFLCLTPGARLASGQPATTLAYAYCSASTAGARYFSAAFSAPFEKDPRGADPSYHTMVTWGRAFADYIEQKYGGPVSGQCALATSLERAQAGVKGGIASAKRLMQKPVETDWVYKSAAPPGAAAPPAQAAAASSAQTPPNAAAVASSQAAQPTAPNETRPAAPAATPSQQVRDLATKDGQEALTTCNQDRALYRALDCYKVQRLVYNYRMEHASDTPEPLATLFEKLDCSSCVDNVRTPAWAKQQAHGSGNQPAVSECVGQRFMAAFLTKPYLPRLMEVYNATLAACKR
jgi:hypothetical protein